MTRFRLAVTAALCIPALLVTATGGEAQQERSYKATTSCRTTHPMTRDFVHLRTEVMRQARPGRRAGASRLVPVKGAKVITKLIDLVPQNGNNVLKVRDSDRTNADGLAKTKHEFNNFGNYKVKVKVKVGGEVVEREQLTFGVSDRVDGKCDPPTEGRP